jgi:hypothetical protein
MSFMSRSAAPGAAALFLLLGLTASASAQSPAQQAKELADDGIAIQKSVQANDPLDVRGRKFAAAEEKFYQATVLSPEGKYYFFLCSARYWQGKYGLALTACKAVAANGADANYVSLADRLINGDSSKGVKGIKEYMREQGIDPDAPPPSGDDDDDDGPGPDPVGDDDDDDGPGPDPVGDDDDDDGPGPDPVGDDDDDDGPGPDPKGDTGNVSTFVGEPPEVVAAAVEPHKYVWAVGGAIGGLGSNVGGDNYGTSGFQFRGFADFLVRPQMRLGVQGYLQFTTLAANAEGFDDELSLFDIGGAVFKHFPFGSSFAFTPLVGASLALVQPTSATDEVSMVALGLRLEGTANIAFGPKKDSVLGISLALGLYTPASGESAGFTAEEYGLDKVGRTVALNLSYTKRFSTPFGTNPFFTLQ